MQPLGNSKSGNIFAQKTPSMMSSSSKRGGVLEFVKSMKFLAAMVIVLQLVIIFLLVNPINLLNQLNAVQVINKVSSLVVVPPNEVPQVIAQVGDKKNLPTADELREENAIQAAVYKDAQDGDYVLLYSNKMIVYREKENRVIYEGDTPAAILQKTQQDILTKVTTKAKDAGIISSSSDEVPQLSTITDVANLQKENPSFYSNAANDDVIALFQSAGKIVIYRPDTDTIVNSGSYNFNIQ